jgi:hypothetical protein
MELYLIVALMILAVLAGVVISQNLKLKERVRQFEDRFAQVLDIDEVGVSLHSVLEETVSGLEGCVQDLSREFEPPRLNSKEMVFRHTNKHDLLASFLKAVRLVSLLNATLVLLREGYVQEIYALCRFMDEALQDIIFLSSPLGEQGEGSKDQIRFINEFFQEEFDDPEKAPVSAKRDRVPRKKISAALSKREFLDINPSDMQSTQRTLLQTFSGFVHGAYPHIMELYGGMPPKYHTSGMIGTPRIRECESQLVNNVFRSLIAAEMIAARTKQPEVQAKLIRLNIRLIEDTDIITQVNLESANRRLQRLSSPDDSRKQL